MSMARVILLRHGRTQWNSELRWQGKTDIPLDEVGHAQAKAAAAAIANLNPTAIVSSNLQRAHRTAMYVSEATGLSVDVDANLRETDGGLWEGMTQSEIREQYPDELSAWFSDPSKPAGLTGESPNQVGHRIAQAVNEHARRVGDGLLVVATHGGATRMGLLSLMDLPMTHLSAFRVLNNCAWAMLDFDERHNRWQIIDYNHAATTPLFEQHL